MSYGQKLARIAMRLKSGLNNPRGKMARL